LYLLVVSSFDTTLLTTPPASRWRYAQCCTAALLVGVHAATVATIMVRRYALFMLLDFCAPPGADWPLARITC